MEEVLEKLQAATFFSALDLENRFFSRSSGRDKQTVNRLSYKRRAF